VSNFGRLKTPLTQPFFVNPALGMQYQGTLLDLDEFPGDVFLISSTFTENVVKYSNCDVGRMMMNPSVPTSDLYPNYGTKSKMQIKSLISIVNHKLNIYAHDNTFTHNTGTKGILYLDMKTRVNTRVMFLSNRFNNNAGYLDSSVIFFRARGRPGINLDTEIPT
jgi:hypothetical protein